MKKILPTLLILILCSNLFGQTKLKIYFISHNEDQLPYLTNQTSYLNARTGLKNFTTMVKTKNAKFNHGSDHVFLRAVAKYDTGSANISTNNKNIVRWMKEDNGVECDPHAHETTYSYADVAYFFTQIGVTPSNTMSGFLYNQLQNGHDWTTFQNGVPGDSFPNFTWHPEIMWGGGTPAHTADLNYYAVFKPKKMADFNTHEPSNHLIMCGTGCPIKIKDTSKVTDIMGEIRRTVNAIQSGALPANGIYPQEVFFNDGDVNKVWFLPLMTQLTDSINLMVAAGKVEWKNISEIVNDWKTAGEHAFAADCDFNVIIENNTPTAISDLASKPDFKIYPNPTSDRLYVNTDSNKNKFTILNAIGGTVMEGEMTSSMNEIDVTGLQGGMYLLLINHKDALTIRKFAVKR